MDDAVDPPNDRQWVEFDEQQPNSNSYALSGKIMLASIVILFAVVVFLVLLHLYARWYLLRMQRRNHHHNRRRNRHNRSTRIVFYLDPDTGSDHPTGGLDPSVLKSLPVFVYSSSESDESSPECAVCLSEFEEGETGRVLPTCKHKFHTECIDMWFHSNSTCPLCRSPVEIIEPEMTMLSDNHEPGSSNLTTSPVRPETTSLGDRRKGIDVRIDVPTRTGMAAGDEFRLSSPTQGFRSPASRLLALRRILSMSRKSPAVSPSSGVGPSRLPAATESDVELVIHESTRVEGENKYLR